ncbi:MAG: chorismate mutase [Bacteroidetes bacterium]|jgi:chorismate mutase-like protein|nr:chorismate mutase [Bacteroidota bacterium]
MTEEQRSTLQEALDRVVRQVEEQAQADATAQIEPWRQRIDAIDQLIIALMNHRADCANRIGHVKKQHGMPVYVPSREKAVLENVCRHNHGPLPDDAVKRLFERVIDETRSLERQRYQDDPDANRPNPTNG